MRRIAIEEHASVPEYIDYLRKRKECPYIETRLDEKGNRVDYMVRALGHGYPLAHDYFAKILDTGVGRLAEMDKFGLDMQVICLAGPSTDEIDTPSGTAISPVVNDGLARAVQDNPRRLAALAAIAPANPAEAARELERAVKQLGMVGAKLNSHGHGEYLDAKKYWPVWEKAAELEVPIYLHPKNPLPEIAQPFSTYPVLTGAAWGYAADTGLHAMRLICSGLFDAYPKLQIILGHMGEAIPFWLWRIDNHWVQDPISKKLKRKPSEYFRDNFYITTSGVFSDPPFLCAYLMLGADRIMFAADTPYERNEVAVPWMNEVPISDPDKEKIYHVNAERLFKLKT
jgi:5-carboxyvanillate decarboxylase